MAKIKPLTGKFGDFSGIVLKAAAAGNLPAAEYYLSINPEWLNQVGPHGRTMLWEATYKGRTEMVAELISRGAGVHAMGSYYTPMLVELSALAVSTNAGYDEITQLLKDNGAKDDVYAACHRGDFPTVKRFLKKRPKLINIPARDEEFRPRMGWHLVHYAVAGRQLEMLEFLIEKGATVTEFLTCLYYWSEDQRAIRKLIRDQAAIEKPKTKQRKKRAPSKVTNAKDAKTNRKKKTKPSKRIPKIDQPNWLGFPPLVDACRGNHNAQDDAQRVKKILNRGANVNVQDYKQKTPLHRSSQAGFIKITELLIEHGADLSIQDKSEDTPIFDAAFHGRTETLKILIENGADTKHQNSRGETALFLAAKGGNLETFQELCAAGVDLKHLNNRGESIVDFLKKRTNPKRKLILEWLKSSKKIK